jgi:hypothetical protein
VCAPFYIPVCVYIYAWHHQFTAEKIPNRLGLSLSLCVLNKCHWNKWIQHPELRSSALFCFSHTHTHTHTSTPASAIRFANSWTRFEKKKQKKDDLPTKTNASEEKYIVSRSFIWLYFISFDLCVFSSSAYVCRGAFADALPVGQYPTPPLTCTFLLSL